MELFLKISVVAICLLIIALACSWLIRKKLLYDHRLLAFVAKHFYNYFHSVKEIKHLSVSNYGYAPVDKEIAAYHPDLQPGIQLYKELVKNHNGFLISENYSVVEVGCGKGAGAEFLIKKFKPGKFTGIDYSEKAISFCNDNYRQIENADFICADAHRLPVGEQSADVVINVESSHIYKSMDKFLKEVYRVLKPDGKFLIADYRYIRNIPIHLFEKKIADCGFSIADKRIITPQVKEACTRASHRREKIIEEDCPWYLKKYFRNYAILNGTRRSKMLSNGEIVYFIYHLEKR